MNTVQKDIKIEISRLSKPVELNYRTTTELETQLKPGIDGVIINTGNKRATFLPHVWDKIPDKSEFLTQLCLKLGVPGDFWKFGKLKVFIYQVEHFSE